jgi:murein DD-endopeptidase MepM/ murein hydrolase activator NlpD
MQESGVDPTRDNESNPPSGAHGIAQWLGGRLDNERAFAQQQGKDPDDLGVQLEFLWYEVTAGSEVPFHALDALKAATTLEDAVTGWELNFERAGTAEADIPRRVQNAQDVLTKYGSNSSVGSGNTTPTIAAQCKANGQVVGSYSLPLDKHWYDEHPEWFTQPHHDYPAIDIPVPDGTPVYSVSAGKIISAPVGGGCGVGVEIDAGDNILLIYCHGSDGGSVDGAHEGDQVKAGQLIMHSSYTGHVIPAGPDGAHLHFGIMFNGTNLCPQTFLIGIAAGSVPDIKSLPSSGCTYVSGSR